MSQNGLAHFLICLSGDGHGQDNEFDTHRVAQLGPIVQSRILRQSKGNLNVNISSPYNINCQKSYAHFLEEYIAQSPKTINLNASVVQPRDLTASKYKYLLRGRSFHSSSEAKENNQKSLPSITHVSNIKDAEGLNLEKGSESITSVSM